jgi:tetratricopeptide (TPR) repeat protein
MDFSAFLNEVKPLFPGASKADLVRGAVDCTLIDNYPRKLFVPFFGQDNRDLARYCRDRRLTGKYAEVILRYFDEEKLIGMLAKIMPTEKAEKIAADFKGFLDSTSKKERSTIRIKSLAEAALEFSAECLEIQLNFRYRPQEALKLMEKSERILRSSRTTIEPQLHLRISLACDHIFSAHSSMPGLRLICVQRAEETYAFAKKHFVEQDPDVLFALYRVAKAKIYAQRTDEAAKELEFVFQKIKPNDTRTEETAYSPLYFYVLCGLTQVKLKAAASEISATQLLQMLVEPLDYLTEPTAENAAVKSNSLNHAALLCLHLFGITQESDYLREAKTHLDNALRCGIAHFSADSLRVAETNMNFSRYYSAAGDHETALNYVTLCLQTRRELYSNENAIEVIRTYRRLAEIYLDLGNIEGAREYAQLATQLASSLNTAEYLDEEYLFSIELEERTRNI